MADGTTVGNSSNKQKLFKHHLMEFLEREELKDKI
jgi:hypothetical protein